MKLYHYTGTHHIEGIRTKGILPGNVPTPRGDVVYGFVWLTTDSDWRQPWATMHTLDCDRTAVRFTIVIPKSARGCLHDWTDVAPAFGYRGAMLEAFNFQGRGAAWRLFEGHIPRGWLRGIEVRPSGIAAPAGRAAVMP